MTTAILMVVVIQLAITGLHELSESQVLPSGPEEMALIGPIVKNETFFFVTILALAAAMMIWEWRKRQATKTEGLEGAALRKVPLLGERERLWMMASSTAACVFILLITAEFIYARQSTALSAATPVTLRERRGPHPGRERKRRKSSPLSNSPMPASMSASSPSRSRTTLSPPPSTPA